MDQVYLWINMADLDLMSSPAISPLGWMLQPDETIVATAMHRTKIDEVYAIVATTQERARILDDALQVIAKNKLGRPIRTKIRRTLGTRGKTWKIRSAPVT